MTTVEWVALAVLWWKGGGRAAIGRWLVEQGVARRGGGDTRRGLDAVAAAIDPRLAAPRRLDDARAAALAAVAAARAAGLTVVPWPDRRYPTWCRRFPTRRRSCGCGAIRPRWRRRQWPLSGREPALCTLATWLANWGPDWPRAESRL